MRIILLLSVVLFLAFGCAVAFAVKAPSQVFLGYRYSNIKWTKHVPLNTADYGEGEAGSGGQEDMGEVDLDGDKKPEIIKAIWGPGVSDHSLKVEVYKGKKKIGEIKPLAGIQSNFEVKDIDHDGKMETVIWGGLWDPRIAGEDGVTEKTYEGHSDPHRYVVATYKLIRGEYSFWDVYTTKKKYEPFCEKQPLKD